MTKLFNFNGPQDAPVENYDEWEIDYFDVDPWGRKLFEPLLGVRVNGGTWIKAEALTEAMQAEKDARHLKAISGLGESNADS